jgi:hypothetical protein
MGLDFAQGQFVEVRTPAIPGLPTATPDHDRRQ